MKKFILLLAFIALTCFASEPKLHFRDCVKIKNGFYADCKGTIEEYSEKYNDYTINIDNCRNESVVGVHVKYEDVELSKGCE